MIILNKEHCTLGFVFGYNVDEMNKSELEAFVKENIREKSAKTGKLIKINTFKINTFKWTKAELKDLVSKYLDACYQACPM